MSVRPISVAIALCFCLVYLSSCTHVEFCLLGGQIVRTSEGGKKITLAPKDSIRVFNLGSQLNASGLDYAPTVNAKENKIYFISDRKGSMPSRFRTGAPSHDIWSAKVLQPLQEGEKAVENIDTTGKYGERSLNTDRNEGVLSITTDGKTIYFTACLRDEGFGDCDIYVCQRNKDGSWGEAKNVGREINSQYWEAQPCISPDGTRLYFVSNRIGDNIDMWYSDYDADNMKWQPPVRMDVLNSKGREFNPSISADNRTFFFSSDGRSDSYGTMDFYVTRLNEDDTWLEPVNLGLPINSPDVDDFLSATNDNRILYFSSMRKLFGFQGERDLHIASAVQHRFSTDDITTSASEPQSAVNAPASLFFRSTANGVEAIVQAKQATSMSLKVYDLTGHLQESLFEEQQLPQPGTYTAAFTYKKYLTGIYFFRLESGGSALTQLFSIAR